MTTPIRIVDIATAIPSSQRGRAPLFLSAISAGFPSSADDCVEKKLSLDELLIRHPVATFYVRVEGESMRDAGIHSGDVLVVDRAVSPANRKIVVAVVNGEFTVKRLIIKNSGAYLYPENPAFPPLKITSEMDFYVWGVVTYVIHKTD